jgi:hypothetical protein
MAADNDGTKQVAANFSFSAFLFSVFGWALLEARLFEVGAGVQLHLASTALGLSVAALALRRRRRWWPAFAQVGAEVQSPAPERHRISDVASCAALLAAGCVLALSGKAGSVGLFAVCAGAFSFAPWSRIGFCRNHFFVSCAMLGAGAGAVLALTRAPQDSLFYLFWAWVLWAIALSELLASTTWTLPAASRAAAAQVETVQAPAPVASPQAATLAER